MTIKELEKLAILDRMHTFNSNRTHVAKSLGIGVRTLQRKLKAYGIEPGKPLPTNLKLDISSLDEVGNG
jgi:DNA-binding NtrC family response regulator